MAGYGLTVEGFTPKPLGVIKADLEASYLAMNPNFDLSPESPDGQTIGIMSGAMSLLWTELDKVYHSYDPHTASGQALRNIGLLTGLPIQGATRSVAVITLVGIAGTFVPKGSIVSDVDTNEFYTNADSTVGSDVTVLAKISGPTPVVAGTIINVDSSIVGWDSILQSADGTQGQVVQPEQQYRNLRNRTVLRNGASSEEVLEAALDKVGLKQVHITNNDSAGVAPDGTPSRHIQVRVGDDNGVTDLEIATTIFESKAMGVLTFGTSSEVVVDSMGHAHTVYFTKSVAKPLSIILNVTYTLDDSAGASEAIKSDLVSFVNNLLVGEDVIWSHLFGVITPHGGAQVNSILIGASGAEAVGNFSVGSNEYASLVDTDIALTVVVA